MTLDDWVTRILGTPELCRMGHGQRPADGNLGLGWIYYGLARALRPRTAVVIGSYRGFVPLVLARALAENAEQGIVHFIDPSLVDDFWKDPVRVRAHFAEFGAANIRHSLMTTQEYVQSVEYRVLPPVELLFIDGYHSAAQTRFDYEAFQSRLAPGALVLFHDSTQVTSSGIYGPDRVYEIRVKDFVDTLKEERSVQVLDLPLAQGVTLVRRAEVPDRGP